MGNVSFVPPFTRKTSPSTRRKMQPFFGWRGLCARKRKKKLSLGVRFRNLPQRKKKKDAFPSGMKINVFQPESQEQAFATENQRGDTFSGFIQSLLVMLSRIWRPNVFYRELFVWKTRPERGVFWRFIGAVVDDVRIGHNRHGSSFVDS